MAKKRNKKPKVEFPHNPRTIPAHIPFVRYALILMLFSSLIVSCVYAATTAYASYQDYLHKKQERTKVEQELTEWTSITLAYPNFRDAYLHIALLDITLGNIPDAYTALDKAEKLDPNYKPTQDLYTYVRKTYPQ